MEDEDMALLEKTDLTERRLTVQRKIAEQDRLISALESDAFWLGFEIRHSRGLKRLSTDAGIRGRCTAATR